MELQIAKGIKEILASAKACGYKGNYSVYTMYKHKIEALNLTPTEYDSAIRELARILKV